jgi:ankyrin repeat protein
MQTIKKTEQGIENIGNLARNNRLDELKELLVQHEAELGDPRWWSHGKNKSLMECAARDAILAGHEDVVELLFKAGLPINIHAYTDDTNLNKEPLIHFAVKSGKLSMVKLLVEYGVKIYFTPHDCSDRRNDNYGLRTAVKEGHEAIVDYLLECGADANGLCDKERCVELYGGITFLARAAEDGNTHIVESLIKHGADIPSTLNLAYKKKIVYGYKECVSAIQLNCTNTKELQQKADELRTAYTRMVRTCMDYAFGCNFEAKSKDALDLYGGGLVFLKDEDVSGMNFIGVSVAGRPVTLDMLKKEAKSGAENAIITTVDLKKLDNEARKNALRSYLEAVQTERGSLVSEEGIVNLVPLSEAAKIGDIDVVNTRIQAGADPNLEEELPITSAIKNGHPEIVKILLEAHAVHKAKKAKQLFTEAKKFISSLEPSVKTLSVVKGRVHRISIPLKSDKCQIIIPGDKRLTSIMRMIREIGQESLNESIQDIVKDAEAKKRNFVMLVGRDGSTKHFKYSNQADRKKLRKEITNIIKDSEDGWNYFPAIFTNESNCDVLETLIITQYQDMDKSKTAVSNVINVRGYENGVSKELNKDPGCVNMMFAALGQKDGIVLLKLLKEHGADFNAISEDGSTLLCKAVCALLSGKYIEENLKMLDFLLANGANPRIKGRDGLSPLMLLIEKKDSSQLTEDAIELLITRFVQHGVNEPKKHAVESGQLSKPPIRRWSLFCLHNQIKPPQSEEPSIGKQETTELDKQKNNCLIM